ncbi:MAG TPA: hypothetical protein EYP49_01240, partial [Anaerolineae bacterium]|nr:hypothetical protein [Anaerolineae bacterium]
MITQSESGLSAADYSTIQSETGNLAIEVLLQRYGPVWELHDSNSRSGTNFDAAVAGTYLLRAHAPDPSTIEAERLASESGGDQSWASVAVSGDVSDLDDDVDLSLVTDGLQARIFYFDGGRIVYTECADISTGSFGTPVVAVTVDDVVALAAVSLTKVYYATRTDEENHRFHCAEYNAGSWSVTSSDVYWPFTIYAMDALTIGSRDLVVLASELWPLLGTRAVGTEIATEVNRQQGLVMFWIENDRWSDYALFDVIDNVKVDPSRSALRLSYLNNIIFASYLRGGGGDTSRERSYSPDDVGVYLYSKLAVSRSKDGECWEFPEFIAEANEVDTPDAPALILPRSDYLYCVGINQTLRSPRCVWAGQTPVEQDVTDRVLSLQSTAAEMRSTQVQLANPGDALAGTLAMSDDRIQAVHRLGYNADGSEIKITVSTEDVLRREAVERLPVKHLALLSRDALARVNRVRADFAAEWPSQQAGRDDYDDPTGTGYGGLRFTAPYEGSWKTPKPGELHLLSSNKEGLAVSTFVTDAFNGSAQTAFKLHTTGQGEYAGIAFRIHD